MKKNWSKRIIVLAVTGTLVTQPLYKWPNTYVYGQEIQQAYVGRNQAEAIIQNLNFSDVTDSHWAKEAVTRLGAMDIVKGYNLNNQKQYNPSGSVTNQEALAFILRLLDLEEEAQQAGEVLENNLQLGNSTLPLWSLGYLQLASQMGLITNAQLQDALAEDQGALEGGAFLRSAPATREQVAEWLVKAINQYDPELIGPVYQQNYVFNFQDWGNITPNKVPYVEAVSSKGIMIGDNNSFRPKSSLTRAEMAQVLKNVDEILYDLAGVERKYGVIEKVEDENIINNPQKALRKFYIRNSDGGLDTIQYEYVRNENRVSNIDVPVLKNGTVQGLNALRAEDQIEYLVEPLTNQVLYVNHRGVVSMQQVRGVLQPLHDLNNGKVTIKTPAGSSFTYQLSDRLYYDNNIKVGDHFVDAQRAPIGQYVVLDLQDNLVTGLDYYNYNTQSLELNGVVREIDANYGYITIVDYSTGNEITKYFYRNDVNAIKQMHYDTISSDNYIDNVFNTTLYDPRTTTIDRIEAGDIVHMKINPDNPDYITDISAKTNYVVKYGNVRSMDYVHQDLYRMTVQFEDGQLAYYEVDQAVVIRKGSSNIPSYDLKAGDWVKLLVNQAVIGPGHIEDTIKEISVDRYKNNIATVYRGQLGSRNKSQNTFSLLNSQELGQNNWLDYKQSRNLTFKENQMEVYYKGERISLDDALYRYAGSNYVAYVAMESLPGADSVVRVSIYDDTRSTILDQDYVLDTNGGQSFTLFNTINPIVTDPGTIIIRNGRLVEASNILAPDYTQVVLGGAGAAAVVNITQEPGNTALTLSRGRVKEIEDNQSFVVSSQGMLRDMTWVYSPIERTYTIDYETVIKDENGFISFQDFRDYDEMSQVDEVYTIISEGTKAKYLIKNPYATEGFVGVYYGNEGNSLSIRNVSVYDSNSKVWDDLSLNSNYARVLVEENSIILKNNKAISIGELKEGDRLRVYNTENLAVKLKQEGSRETVGYIILVE
jgi:hypothetical protein